MPIKKTLITHNIDKCFEVIVRLNNISTTSNEKNIKKII